MTRRRTAMRRLALVGALAALAAPVAAQTPGEFDGCIAEALTQSATIAADGGFRLVNVPSTTGLLFRVLVTCPTAKAESRRRLVSPFTRIAAGQTLTLAATDFTAEAVPPSKLTLRAPRRILGFTGDRIFTVLEGQFPDGSRRNLTYPQTGTTFRSSNSTVATVDATGCVFANQPGVSTIAAFNSGRTASLRVSVAGGADTDADGMSDACEQASGLDRLDPTDADDDPDADGLDNRAECLNGTSPFAADSDADGLDDADELAAETDPLDPDTDADGLTDGDEITRGTDPVNPDTDTDCLPDGLEIRLGTNPLVVDGPPDADGDGVTNCDELAAGTDPGSRDSDGDAIDDGEELVTGADGFITDPLRADTDGDGLNDEAEIAFGSNPTDPTDLRTQVVIDGRNAVLSGRVRLNSLTLRNGAVLSHAPTTADREQRLELEVAGTLTIDASSRIDVSARGFLGGRAAGNPADSGRTLGNVAGSQARAGGSYGGLGVQGNVPGVANPVYGDFRNPNEPGSGGASQSGAGGNGGGVARISAAAVVLDGEIAADGGEGLGDIAAGGSGGAIRLDVGTLSGAGRIHANGGVGDDQLDQAGGGGGGRVALYYNQLNGFVLTRIAAVGGLGNGQRTGGPGSVYIKRRADLRGQLIVRGAGIETPLPEAIATDDVLLDAATVAVEQLRPNTLSLVNGALLTHPGASGTQAPQLAITPATVTIDALSRIDVSTRGFLGGRAAGNPGDAGRTLGNLAGSQRRGGGSYGGLGNVGDTSAPINPVYGDFRNPAESGSGGASESGSGGNGGGVVRLQATALTLDGQILADGGEGLGDIAAGGSGGAIRIDVGTLSGGGSVHANGGPGDDQLDQAGGGGGGRVAIYYATLAGFDVAKVQALGGQGRGPLFGGVGTVYLESAAQDGGDLILDNAGRVTGLATPLYSLRGEASTALGANSLRDDASSFVPGSLVGLELNPNTAQDRTFTVIANDATTLFTDPADGDVRAVAATGQSYGAEPVLGTLTIAHNAVVEVLDGDGNRADRRGFLTSGAIELSEDARLQHPVATTTSTFGLELSVDGELRIDESSRIEASARGFLGGRAGGNGGDPGLTIGNVAGSTRRNGGSYGGLGGFGDGPGSVVAAVYGDFRDPDESGSGGASESGSGGNGGGLIRIGADSIVLDGHIAADGSDGLGDIAGGGSGGAIRIDVGALAGAGSIHANGGPGDDQLDQAGGGGGGRIAIYYDDAGGFDLAERVTVAPGAGRGGNAGPGSVFLRKRSEAQGELRVRGSGRETPLAAGVAGDRLVLDAARVAAAAVPVASLTLRNGAVLTHDGATGTTMSNLAVTVAGTLTIDATSRIDVSARGFLGGRTAGNGADEGRTVGNVPGSQRRTGGSYGGLGVIGDFGSANPVYGDFRNPNEPGSGGASHSGSGGNGGGLARISAAAVMLDGQIAADGGEGLGDIAAGGSGGAIRLDVGTLSGVGSIHANGGIGDDQLDQAGGGGGGRVAVYYDQLSGFALTRIAAVGGLGNGQRTGGPGTVYVKRRADLRGQLIVRGAGIETPLPEAISTDDVLVDAATVAVELLQPNTLALVNGALLTHPGATSLRVPRLVINAATANVDATSRIDVSARGFLGGRTADNPGDPGRTLGNVTGSQRRGGGSYGGLGNPGDASAPINPVYGDFRNPNDPGSGGASESGSGGNGGGVVRLQATALTLDGQILADGGEGLGDIAAGGSGGAVRIDVGTLSGGGRVHADGGSGDDQLDQAGGGGGGRIAIHYATIAGFDAAKVQARGGQGRGASFGGVGTVFFKLTAQPGGELILDNANRVTDRATPLYSLQGAASTSLAANSLSDAAASFVPGTLVGLELNPDTTQTQTFTVVANDATTLFTDPADGNLTTVASGGDAYGAEPVLDRIEIRRRAVVEVLDGDANRDDRRGLLSASELTLSETALLQHPVATTSSTFGLELTIDGPLSIDATSRIDANARGFLGGRAGANGGDAGLTIGNVAGSTRRNGASYGGLGGFGSDPGGVVNPVYGNAQNPNEPGSGGASQSGSGGNGGGLIRVTADTLALDGQIAADGSDGLGDIAAGGSGGAIRVDVGVLAGAGSVHANGGPGDDQLDQAGGGGGGRIAIYADQSSGFPLANVQANGGPGLNPGQAGTIHIQP